MVSIYCVQYSPNAARVRVARFFTRDEATQAPR
jgi:hypothetical protein